jgi:hypothetical protein
MECRGGGCGGGGDDHDDGSNASSPNNKDNGAEEEEVAVNIVKDKGEDFTMGSTLIHQDNAATMMDMLPPLIVHRPYPLRGSPLQRDNRMAGAKNWWHPQATTAAKVGIVACAMASSGAMTNNMDTVAWRQSHTDINDNDDNNDQC